jgi:hypothetical protein
MDKKMARGAGDLPASSFSGPAGELIAHELLSPPSHPGSIGRVDDYDVIRLIGRGGMGFVFLARNAANGGMVALKMLRPEYAVEPRVVRRFLKEARHLQKLGHPSIMPVLSVSDRPEAPYFVMPHYAAGSLAGKILPGEALGTSEALEIARQLADAIEFIHGKGLVHRDIKPGNILLEAPGVIRLSDFGLAQSIFNDSMIDLETVKPEGTAPYMSPATAEGRAEDTRCDIYGFGAVLYEMLTGKPPYEGESARAILEKIRAGPPAPIRQVNPGADAGLAAIAECAMARPHRDRYASMADVVSDLEAVAKDLPPRARGMARGRFLRKLWAGGLIVGERGRRNSVKAAAGVGAVLAGAGLVFGLVLHQSAPVQPPAPQVVLDETFAGKGLNKERWRWANLDFKFQGTTGEVSWAVSQTNHEAVIRAAAFCAEGWTTRELVFLDLARDMKLMSPGPFTVTIDMAVLASNSHARVQIADAPTTNANSISLLDFHGNHLDFQKSRHEKVTIEVRPDIQAAIIYHNSVSATPFEPFDLKSLAAWHLRFSVDAFSSSGFGGGAAEMRLKRVRMETIPEDDSIVGKVTELRGGLPIADAVIEEDSGITLGRTLPNGAFRLQNPNPKRKFKVKKDGYVDPEWRPLGQRPRSFVHCQLAKTAYGFGDIVSIIPWGGHKVLALGFWDDAPQLVMPMGETNSCVRKLDITSNTIAQTGWTTTLVRPSSVVHCEDRLLAARTWPGEILEFAPNSCSLLLKLQHPGNGGALAWPYGTAFDGNRLWLVENDGILQRRALHALDITLGTNIASISTTNELIRGLAWDGKQLWVADGDCACFKKTGTS